MSFADKPELEVVVFETGGELRALRADVDTHNVGAPGVELTLLDANEARRFARDCGVCTLPAVAGLVGGRPVFVQHGPVSVRTLQNALCRVLKLNYRS